MVNQMSENQANQQQEQQETYFCDCGCNIEFIKYALGIEMYFIHNGIQTNKLLSEPGMLNNSWNNYINMELYKTWLDLWTYICNNKNANNVMKHLYNEYQDFYVPVESVLSLECIF